MNDEKIFINGARSSAQGAQLEEALRGTVETFRVESGREVEIHAFRNGEIARSWAKGQPFEYFLNRTDELIAKARELEKNDHSAALKRQQVLSERVLTDLRELGTRLGLDPDSAELSQIAHKGVSVLEPPVLQSVLLFDKPGCQTLVGWLPKGVPFPSLLGARNKVESLRIVVWGYVGLWDKRWFRGPAFHAFSTIGTAFNLGPYGNQAESGMHW